MTKATKSPPAADLANSRIRNTIGLRFRCWMRIRRVLHKKRASKPKTKMEVETPNKANEKVAISSGSSEAMIVDKDQPDCGNKPALEDQPFRFLDLPKELRLMVYDLLVVVGKIFYSPDWYELAEHKRFSHWTQYALPSLEIFYICKQIKEEAEDVYLSRNLFVLPYSFKKTPPISMWCKSHSFRPVFSRAALESLRNLSVAFCNRASAPLVMTASDWVSDSVNFENNSNYDTMTVAERQAHAHHRAQDFLRMHWNKNVGALKKITASLDTLEIDLNNAFCPWGCCRAFPDIDFGFLCNLKPNTIRLLGLRPGEEAALVEQMKDSTRDELGADFLDKHCKVIGNPEHDPWDKYRYTFDKRLGRKKKRCNW